MLSAVMDKMEKPWWRTYISFLAFLIPGFSCESVARFEAQPMRGGRRICIPGYAEKLTAATELDCAECEFQEDVSNIKKIEPCP